MFNENFYEYIENMELNLDSSGYDKEGYDKNGYDRSGYNRRHFNKQGYFRNGEKYDFSGRDYEGYNMEGYNICLIDRNGYKKNGFHERTRLHRNGTRLDDNGYDIRGYNKEGYNYRGFNSKGINKNGTLFDQDGFDRFNKDKEGYNRDGFKEVFVKDNRGISYIHFLNKEGYAVNGFDKYGYDRDGFDKNGLDKLGEYFGFIENYISKNTKIILNKQNLFIYRLGIKDILVNLYNAKRNIKLDNFEDVIINFNKSIERFVDCVLIYLDLENIKYKERGKKGKLRVIEEKRLFQFKEIKKLRLACDDLFKFKKNEIIDIISDFEVILYKWLEVNNNKR